MALTYKVFSLGCRANQADALSYAGVLERAGWRAAAEAETPELVLVQSCTVTMSVDAQDRQMVRKIRRESPFAKIVMTGCYAQQLRPGLGPADRASTNTVVDADYIIGNLDPRKWELLAEIAQA